MVGKKKIKEPNKILLIIGVIMILVGFGMLIISTSGVYESFIQVNTPAGSLSTNGLSPFSITFIFVGALLILLGMGIIGLAYKVGR